MKTNQFLNALAAAILLGAAPTGSQAAARLAGGDFDNLTVGTAPDVGIAAGRWQLDPAWPEATPSQISIVPAPAGGTGNCLLMSLAAAETPAFEPEVMNLFPAFPRSAGQILTMSFDIYVEPGRGGGDTVIEHSPESVDRAVDLRWKADGILYNRNSISGDSPLFPYLRGVWQSVRVELDLANDRYNLYWSQKGQPVTQVWTNLPGRATGVSYVDRVGVIRFPGNPDVQAYYDNFQVSAGPPAAVIPAYSLVTSGGSVTLSPTNTLNVPSTYQWQLHGTNLPGATSSTLPLSNLTLDQSGPYSVIVSNEYEVVTATAAQVQVVDELTLLTEPASTNVFPGSNVTFRVAALSPRPITYQWHRNGTPIAGATNPTLTLTNVQLAHDGLYTVVVSDSLRSLTTQAARLTVYVGTVITLAPISQSVVAGGSVTFSVEIDGNPGPFDFEWRRLTNPRFTNRFVLDAKRSFFTLSNVTTNQAGTYAVVVRNASTPAGVNRSFALTLLADTDGDGLPDDWETAHGLSTTDATDAALDRDGDGHSNLAEYRAGTNPTNAASCLKIEGLTRAGGQAALTFNAVSNQTYTLEWSSDLGGGAWTKLADVTARTNSRLESVTDPAAGGDARFYRVVSPRRP